MTRQKGKFIVIEGLDGSGKSIQAKILSEHLKSLGYKINLSAEPTTGPIGSMIRQVLTHRLEVDARTLTALFAADRLDHIFNPVNGINKHLTEGIIEVSDRYDLTSYAYQSRFVDKIWVWQVNSQAIRPDLTIFLDVQPKVCYERLKQTQIEQDKFHVEQHLLEAREEYLRSIERLRSEKQETIIIIDANHDIPETSRLVRQVAEEWLSQSLGKTQNE